ncbi:MULTISPECIES: YtjB family periplasmic protein [unclassified Vibrio]|uniref:AhpA/YtjB family protein n=1 Tax=Vibrio sp. HB236076 TaxID=3232307 RepID=A0AB39HGB9_9VIBR|nr:AhpA/YtjB family protein [Vibrio sp. HB161653]MDP5254923.1 AhpA/YtjB family protein [Vibrio sp. HB161653]
MTESLFSVRNTLKAIALVILAGILFFTVKNSVVISQGNASIQSKQLETLTHILISQAALSASQMITEKDQDQLLDFANQLAHEHLVHDATIYDAQGVTLAASDKASSAREILGLDTPLATARIGRQQLVEPIYDQHGVAGFIRITFENGKVTAISNHHYRKSDRYMYIMIIANFIAGMLFVLILQRQSNRKRING